MATPSNPSTSIELPNKAYILPDAIANWPPVWWFWPVLVGSILIVGLFVFFIYRRHITRAYRREAIQALLIHNEMSDQALVEHCLTVIKRCLITEGRTDLASLTSQQLLPILDKQIKRSRLRFSDLETEFIETLYRPNGSLDNLQRKQIIDVTSLWIRRHRA